MTTRTKATLALAGTAVVAGVALSQGSADATAPTAATSTVTATTTRVASASPTPIPTAVGGVPVVAGAAPAATSSSTGSTGSSPAQVVGTGDAAALADTNVMIVLDSSQSMGRTAGGTTKMEQARTAISRALESLPSSARVGLRVYGSTVAVGDPLKPTKAACADSRLVVPVGPVDKPRIEAVVSVFKPFGYSPTSYALQQAAADLGTSGRRAIILVSDGQDSCTGDPAAAVSALRKDGIGMTVSAVGLHAEAPAAKQMQSVATAGGGTYQSAASSSELESGLRHILERMQANDPQASAAGTTGSGTTGTGTTGTTGTGTTTTTDTHGTGLSSSAPRSVPAGLGTVIVLVLIGAWLSNHKK